MPQFKDILGQSHITDHLTKGLLTQRISHAYLFSGEEKSGKKMIATTLAMALLCSKRGEGAEPCGTCSSCIRVKSGAHPDVRVVTHEKETSLRVGEIITQVVDDVVLTPYEAERKIYIIPDAELMTIEAQNKLLKTLEEPPHYAHFFLLTQSPEALLETVRSRLVPMNVRPVENGVLMQHLTEKGHTPYRALLAIRFARGNAGRALMLAGDEDFMERTDIALEMMEQLNKLPFNELSERTRQVLGGSFDKAQTRRELMQLVLMLIRDISIYKATESASHLIFTDRLEYIRDVALHTSYHDLMRALRAVSEATERIDANVSPQFVMESMMLRARDMLQRR